MGWPKRRVERIKKEIPIIAVLASFGYQVRSDGGGREQQFPCDLHGDGRDNKPSARVYPDSQQFYCFACDRSRDAIELVRIKKNLSFPEAMSWLESQYGLQPLPWEGPEPQTVRPGDSRGLTDECLTRITPPVTFEAGRGRVKDILDRASFERSLALDRLLAYWETYDYLTYQATQAGLDERLAKQKIGELHHRLTKEMLG